MTTVLVIEDDDRIRLSLLLALEDEGYATRAVATAEEGLAAQRHEPADTVLVDLMLPGIDGFECIRTLRRDDDVPIIVVSARDDTHDIVAGLEAGADDYLVKPVADQGTDGPAAGAAPPGPRRRRTPVTGGHLRRPGDLPGGRRGAAARPAGGGDPHRVPAAVRAGRDTPARCCPASSCCSGSGGTTSATNAWSTCTSAGCGRRSRTDPGQPRHLVTVRGLGYKLQR